MRPLVRDLAAPVEREARLVARAFLADAADAFARLDRPEETEALHDFRVALRRMRSWSDAFRPHLEASVHGKLRRRLRALARATNDSRDLEVQLEWLGPVAAALDDRERPGAEWLIACLTSEKARSDEAVRGTVVAEFGRLRERLDRRLEVYTLEHHLDRPDAATPFAAVAAALVRRHAGELADHLAHVRTAADEEEGHEARISGKRLRYLLEPVGKSSPGASEAVRELKELQDALGDLHDAHVLSTRVDEARRDPALAREHAPGLDALAARLERRAAEAFALIEARWLGDGAAPLLATVERAAAALAAAARGAREIERKYLLTDLPPEVRRAPSVEIEQGYLPGERIEERVRRAKGEDGTRWFRTVKAGTGLSRLEHEEEATRAIFRSLWPLTRGRRVWKRRYRWEHEGVLWEVDDFLDRDLVLAEVELPAEDAAVAIPGAIAAYLDREVTGDAAFSNAALAR